MQHDNELQEGTVSNRVMELIVAAAFMAVAGVVMWDSHRVGASWASDGPQAGYFPFFIGLIMFVSAAITFLQHARGQPGGGENFVPRSALWRVLEVLIPAVVFVVLIGYLGIYVSGALFISYFMLKLGRYGILPTIAVAAAVPVALFFMFEVWFLVPLPKGPLEAALGY
jgi:putative tricarboxylic transport membrane protein